MGIWTFNPTYFGSNERVQLLKVQLELVMNPFIMEFISVCGDNAVLLLTVHCWFSGIANVFSGITTVISGIVTRFSGKKI